VIVGKYLLGMNGGIEMNCGLAEEVAIIDKLGYDYIELRNWKVDIFLKDHSFDDLRALMESVKVKPLSVNGVFLEHPARCRFELPVCCGLLFRGSGGSLA
jgi:hypothetical protein